MTRPLRSTPITEGSSLLRADPPLCRASILSLSRRASPLGIFSYHRGDRFPRSARQPDTRSRRFYAGGRILGRQVSCMLITIRFRLSLLTSCVVFTTPQQRFRFIRLPISYLTAITSQPFTGTLTTTALDRSSFQRFGTCSCKPIPRGLPSSVVQLDTSFLIEVWCLIVAHENTFPGEAAVRPPNEQCAMDGALTDNAFSVQPRRQDAAGAAGGDIRYKKTWMKTPFLMYKQLYKSTSLNPR